MPDRDDPQIPLPRGWRLSYFPELDSTNDELLRRLQSDDALHQVILAARQLSGRGRLNRDWLPGDGNLFMSVAMPVPEDRMPGDLALLAAVATAETTNRNLPDEMLAQIKWPNDILIEDRKAAGILVETVPERNAAVIGIGVNLTTAPKGEGINAAAIAEWSNDVSAEEFATDLCHSLAAWELRWRDDGLVSMLGNWRAAGWRIGSVISVSLPDGEILHGTHGGIDDDGALRLELADGMVRKVTAGEVFFG